MFLKVYKHENFLEFTSSVKPIEYQGPMANGHAITNCSYTVQNDNHLTLSHRRIKVSQSENQLTLIQRRVLKDAAAHVSALIKDNAERKSAYTT